MMPDNSDLFKRKNDHLKINSSEDVRSGISTGLEDFIIEHCALPELSLSDVTTQTQFLEHEINFPLMISSMTGGTKEGTLINTRLAEAAQAKRIAMGLGSQRAALSNTSIARSFNLRNYAPDIPIFANIGAVQLNYGVSIDDCKRLIDIAGADGLILHLNPLQEALQPEGDTKFTGLLDKIEKVVISVGKPVIIKEVGWGISAAIARKLIGIGVAAIDIAGAGGTSWSQVEMYRSKDQTHRRIAADFRSWGIPTAYALEGLRKLGIKQPIIASGGIQNGIEIVKCLALGASMCGIAGKLFLAATVSTDKIVETIAEIEIESKIAMFACGARTIEDMKKIPIIHKNQL